MRLKLFVVLVVSLGYLAVLFACNKTAPPPASLTSKSTTAAPMPVGEDPPHAIDTAGNKISNQSATQPDKPVILAKDIDDPKYGELKPEAAFDHVKHSTDVMYSIDGKTVTTCVECHHTEQPSAPEGKNYLKRFDRKEVLTTQQLETSKQSVKSCRACHLSPASEETDEFPPQSVTYPKEMNKPPSGKLTNDVAYHSKCISCHDAAKKRDPQLKSPLTCTECHVKK